MTIASVNVMKLLIKCPTKKASRGLVDVKIDDVCIDNEELWIKRCEGCGQPHLIARLGKQDAGKSFHKN